MPSRTPLDSAPGSRQRRSVTSRLGALAFGAILLTRASSVAAPPPNLLGSEWLLEDLGGRGVSDRAQAILAFPEAGRIAGNGGCNRYAGEATIEDDRIAVGRLAATRRACGAALMDQEARFLEAIERANRLEWTEPFLVVHVDGMERPLRFTRIGRRQGGPAGEEAEGTVTGTVTWRTAFPIPPDAVLTVRLADAAGGDGPGAVLAEQGFGRLGATPVRFSLSYDPARVDPDARYEITARIEARGGVRFGNRTPYPVALSRGAPSPVSVVLEPML